MIRPENRDKNIEMTALLGRNTKGEYNVRFDGHSHLTQTVLLSDFSLNRPLGQLTLNRYICL